MAAGLNRPVDHSSLAGVSGSLTSLVASFKF